MCVVLNLDTTIFIKTYHNWRFLGVDLPQARISELLTIKPKDELPRNLTFTLDQLFAINRLPALGVYRC